MRRPGHLQAAAWGEGWLLTALQENPALTDCPSHSAYHDPLGQCAPFFRKGHRGLERSHHLPRCPSQRGSGASAIPSPAQSPSSTQPWQRRQRRAEETAPSVCLGQRPAVGPTHCARAGPSVSLHAQPGPLRSVDAHEPAVWSEWRARGPVLASRGECPHAGPNPTYLAAAEVGSYRTRLAGWGLQGAGASPN